MPLLSKPPVVTADPDDPRPALTLVERDRIRVVIADTEPVVRAGFAAILNAEQDMHVVGTACDADGALALVSTLAPDVAVLCLDLPDVGGLDVARRIHDDPRCAGVNVMMIAAQEGDDDLFGALRAGASALIPRSAEPTEVLRAVRAVAGGAAVLSPRATRRLIAAFRSQPQDPLPTPAELDELTPREREVMALVAVGLRNHDIAERLAISRATVKTHVSRTLRKLHAQDRSQLVAIAYQHGLVDVGAPPRFGALPTETIAPAGAAVVLTVA